jgi:hypothetical protein
MNKGGGSSRRHPVAVTDWLTHAIGSVEAISKLAQPERSAVRVTVSSCITRVVILITELSARHRCDYVAIPVRIVN